MKGKCWTLVPCGVTTYYAAIVTSHAAPSGSLLLCFQSMLRLRLYHIAGTGTHIVCQSHSQLDIVWCSSWAGGQTEPRIVTRSLFCHSLVSSGERTIIGPAVRADFRRLYPANAKTPTCCPSDDNRTKVTNSVTSARSLWWHVGPYFWPADLTRTANPIRLGKK